MKNCIILMLLILVASQAFSQKKKKEKNAEVDSLIQVVDTPAVKTGAQPIDTPAVKVDSVAQAIDTPAVKVDSVAQVIDTAAVPVDSVVQVIDTAAVPVDSLAKVAAPAPKAAAAPKATAVAAVAAPAVAPMLITSPEADSLAQVTRLLTAKLNSLSKERETYYGLYTTIKEKVLKRDFDPAKLSEIIDSLAASRDSTFSSEHAISVGLMDSLASLKKEYWQMKEKLGAIQAAEDARARLVSELKQLKELLDSKILTQSEFDTRKSIVLQRWK